MNSRCSWTALCYRSEAQSGIYKLIQHYCEVHTLAFSARPSRNAPLIAERGVLGCKSLTMTYFHTGTRTIIGAKSFHCPVRDGKEWYQLAMVIRHNLLLSSFVNCPANS